MMCIRTRWCSAVTAAPLVSDSIYKVVKYAADCIRRTPTRYKYHIRTALAHRKCKGRFPNRGRLTRL